MPSDKYPSSSHFFFSVKICARARRNKTDQPLLPHDHTVKEMTRANSSLSRVGRMEANAVYSS